MNTDPNVIRVLLRNGSRRISSGCLEWQGAADAKGYGLLTGLLARSSGGAHAIRVAWMIEHGPIPRGRVVMHRCDNPRCIDVAHLSIGTNYDNSRDMTQKQRGHRQARNLVVKLRWAQVEIIREAVRSGAVSIDDLSARLRSCPKAVRYVLDTATARDCVPFDSLLPIYDISQLSS